MSRQQARKRFGQHFLHDQAVLAQIGAAVNLQPGDALFEIGPGRGALTQELYGANVRYRAIEIDRDLFAPLRERFPRLELIEGDVLRVAFDQALADGPWRVVGNLPYNISSPLLARLFEHQADIVDVHVMLQKEMALRLTAEPGTKAYGRLSVGCQVRMEVQWLFEVAPQSFAPPPAVDSAVIRMLPKPASKQLPEPVLLVLDQVLRLAFQQRRKRLSNALKSLPRETVSKNIDLSLRADQVCVADYVALAQALVRT